MQGTRFRPLLDLKASALLANALVGSRLDFCNSLFVSLNNLSYCSTYKTHSAGLSLTPPNFHKHPHPPPAPKWKKTSVAASQIQGTIFKIGLITHTRPASLSGLIYLYISSRNTRHSNPELKTLHIPTFDHRVHKSKNILRAGT